MGKSAGRPPPAPDPNAIAAAQTASNIQTARTQAELNRVNQVTPYGSLTYTQDPGNPDRWTAAQTLSPAEQHMLDVTNEGQSIYGAAALTQLRGVQGMLSRPLDLSTSATEGRLAELGRARLDPMFAQQRSALETQLANQGVARGSEAWANAFRGFDQQQNDAYNQLFLTGHQQAVNDILAERSQPLNELSALLGGGMVQTPQFAATPQTSVANTDVSGAFGLSQSAQQSAYQARAQQAASTNAGVAGVATAAIAAAAIF